MRLFRYPGKFKQQKIRGVGLDSVGRNFQRLNFFAIILNTDEKILELSAISGYLEFLAFYKVIYINSLL